MQKHIWLCIAAAIPLMSCGGGGGGSSSGGSNSPEPAPSGNSETNAPPREFISTASNGQDYLLFRGTVDQFRRGVDAGTIVRNGVISQDTASFDGGFLFETDLFGDVVVYAQSDLEIDFSANSGSAVAYGFALVDEGSGEVVSNLTGNLYADSISFADDNISFALDGDLELLAETYDVHMAVDGTIYFSSDDKLFIPVLIEGDFTGETGRYSIEGFGLYEE